MSQMALEKDFEKEGLTKEPARVLRRYILVDRPFRPSGGV